MLALIHKNEIHSTMPEGGWCKLPNGDMVSPAMDGWTDGDCRLATIQEADEIPEGFYVTNRTIELVEGVPKYVHHLEPFEVPEPQETVE